MQKMRVRPARRRTAATALVAAVISCGVFIPVARPDSVNITWDGAAGDWFDPTQWNPMAVPNNTLADQYLPVIPTGSVTLSANATVSSLNLAAPAFLEVVSGATLTANGTGSPPESMLSGTVQLDQGGDAVFSGGAFLLNNATIGGPGIFEDVDDNGNFSGSNSIANLSIDPGGSLVAETSGSLLVTSSLNANGGTLTGGSLTIAPTAIFNMSTGFISNSGLITNNGSMNAALSAVGIAAIVLPSLINNGSLAAVGASTTNNLAPIFLVHSFTNSAGASLSLITGSLSVGSFFNAGVLSLTSGTLFLGPGGTNFLGGTVTLDAKSEIAGRATLFLEDGLTVSGPGILNSEAATLLGNATVQNAALGVVNSTTSLNAPELLITGNDSISSVLNANLVVAPGASLDTGSLLTLNQSGTLTNNGIFIAPGNIQIATNGAIINNGTLMLGALGTVSEPFTGSTFQNAGLIINANTTAITTGPATINSIVNTGTISGYFTLSGGGTLTGVLSPDIPGVTGNPLPGWSMSLQGTTPFVFENGLELTSSTNHFININAPIVLAPGVEYGDHISFDLAPANSPLTGPGTLTLSGPNTWLYGNMSVSGEVFLLPASTLTIANAQVGLTIIGTHFTNQGLVTPPNNSPLNAPLITLDGGSLLDNSGTIALYGSTISLASPSNYPGDSSFQNEGLITATASTIGSPSVIAAPFYNSGTVTSGASLTILGGGSASSVFTALSAASKINFSHSATTSAAYLLVNASLNGPGLFTGSVSLSGSNWVSNAAFSYIGGPGSITVTQTMILQASPAPSGIFSGNPYVHILPGATLGLGQQPGTLILNGLTIFNEGVATSSTPLPSTPAIQDFTNGALFDNAGIFSIPQNSTPLPLFLERVMNYSRVAA